MASDSIHEQIAREIADVKLSIEKLGFSSELYRPDIGIEDDEMKAYDNPFSPQLLAGLQIFLSMFCEASTIVWGHLMAEMQAGKTGVVCVVIRLLMKNYKQINIRPSGIFLITGMSDNAWRKQTKERVPRQFRDNVEHSGKIIRVKEKLILMAKGGQLKNCFVILDESHIASSEKNRPSKDIYETLRSLCPTDVLEENNVRLLTISATDPAAILSMAGQMIKTEQFRLLTTPEYQSIENLLEQGRLHETFTIKDKPTLDVLLSKIHETYGTEPLWHILRPQQKFNQVIYDLLCREYTHEQVIRWDSTSVRPTRSSADSSISSDTEDDINELLKEAPLVPSFIIIKEMFNASKTLDDTHVGAMYERCGIKDDTNLQRLPGRASGYGKSRRTIVFTSIKQTVTNYIKYWKNFTSTTKIGGKDAKKLGGIMSGVVSYGVGNERVLAIAPNRAIPTLDSTTNNPNVAPSKIRNKLNQDEWVSCWSEWFITEKEVIRWCLEKGAAGDGDYTRDGTWEETPLKKKDDEGFLLCTAQQKFPQRLPIAAIDKLREGSKTTNMGITLSSAKLGKEFYRRYVAYENTNDIGTARFCAHWVRKIK